LRRLVLGLPERIHSGSPFTDFSVRHRILAALKPAVTHLPTFRSKVR
jgi:hypothetical protein